MPELIDRNELRRRIYERFGQYSTKVIATVEEGKIIEDWAFLEPFLNAAPTIEAEPVRQGRWAYGYNSESCMLCHFCTACGKEAYWDTDYGQQLFEFCPNCGARMGRGDDDD